MKNLRMNNRKAFTLMELLVVIGIIAILAGILLPVVNHMRRSAQITGEKADFVAIANALDAYKADFEDYPRNSILPKWNTVQGGTSTFAPIYLSLATALLGPGPGISQISSSGIFMMGDGADGFGSRGQSANYPVTISGASFTSAPFMVTIMPVPVQLNNFIPGQTIATITLSIGTPYEETIGISQCVVTSGQLTLATAPVFPNNHTSGTNLIKIATGRITPAYLSGDTFKVAFIPISAGGGPGAGITGPIGPAGEPVLLDRWGQVIQYFPSYGPANNRTGTSISYGNPPTVVTSIMAGPLYGFSQPYSIDTTSGQNAIFDWRDAAPYFCVNSTGAQWPANPVTGAVDYIQGWPNPLAAASFRPELAFEWMLGDLPATSGTTFNNAIISGEKLGYDGPYILISTGPDGPERNNGGYCSMLDASGNILPVNQLNPAFIASGNIYNFDHQ